MGEVIKMTDADKGVDFTKVMQGHVSANLKNQRFNCERTRPLRNKALKMDALEHIVKDQFGNLYVVITAKLMDGEVYASVAWVGAEKWDESKKTIKLVKPWKKFKTFGDEMLACIQSMAFFSFGQANITWMKGAVAGKTVTLVPDHAEIQKDILVKPFAPPKVPTGEVVAFAK